MNEVPPASVQQVTWTRTVPLRYEADVAVIGGGIAGVCAACAAAREGASVLLVERFAVTGGNATVGGVANWSGETRGQGAIFDEIIADQEAFDSVAPYPGTYVPFTGSQNRVFDHALLAIILQELLARYDVHVLLHTRFVDARTDQNGAVREALLCGHSGPEAVRADIFIDCTGEAQLADTAGLACMKGRDSDGLQLPPSLMFFVRELPEPPAPQLPDGWFNPVRKKEDLPMTSLWPNGPGGKALKLKVPGYDSTDTESMTALESRARRRMMEVLDYYQREEKRPWRLDHASPIIGLREGRRILGDYVLTVEDLRVGRAFDDGVARGVFFLDGMKPDDEGRTYLLSREEQIVPPYQIPLRSLIARDGRNVLMAGRCFSADQHALSSARVMTTCAMMGQAAGVTAGMARARDCGVRDVDPIDVRRRLVDRGADLDV